MSDASVEVAHEAVLREWPRLRDWIEEDDQGRRLRRQLAQASSEWDRASRDDGELYRGARLAATLDWTGQHEPDLNGIEQDFIAESREASERETKRIRRTNRRLRLLLVGVAVLLAAAVAGGVFALSQRSEARDAAARAETAADRARTAQSAELAQRLGAQALVEEDLDRSLLLARQAVAMDDTPQTRGYLFAALGREPAVLGIMHGDGLVPPVRCRQPGREHTCGQWAGPHSGSPSSMPARSSRSMRQSPCRTMVCCSSGRGYSPNGETLAFCVDDHVHLVDANTHEPLAEGPVGDRPTFTADGALLVGVEFGFVGGTASIVAHDARTLEPVGVPITPRTGFTSRYILTYPTAPSFALTADGREVVTASSCRGARLVEPVHGEEAARRTNSSGVAM